MLGLTFREVGPAPTGLLVAYLFGILGLVALLASSIPRLTLNTKYRMAILIGLVAGILSAFTTLYFAVELLSSSRGILGFSVLLCSLLCPVAAAIMSISSLVCVPKS